MLQFSLASVIEALRSDPDKYNNLLYHDMSFLSTISTQPLHIDHYKDFMLDESDNIYDTTVKRLANRIVSSEMLKDPYFWYCYHLTIKDIPNQIIYIS